MAKITYTDKVTLNEQPSISAENKVTDDDMNEIKNVVNTNDDNVGDLSNLKTTTKASIVGAINEMVDGETYSTTEVKTNKIYIDKNNNEYPVYRRVLRGNTGTSTNWVNLGNIPNLLRIVDIRGIISSSGIDYPLNLYVTSTYFVNLRNNNGVIQFNHGNEVNNRDIEVTIEYTKTTD